MAVAATDAVWLDVLPSMKNFQSELNRQLKGAMPKLPAPEVEKPVIPQPDTKSWGAKLADGVRSAGKQTYRAMDQLGGEINSRLSTAFKIGAATVGAAIATSVGLGVNRLLNIEDAQAKLRGLGHDAKAVDRIMESALESVKGTAFGLDQAATLAATAVAAGIEPGRQLTEYLKTVGDAATIAGADLGDMGAIFAQVQSTGRAYTGDLMQLANRGIPIFQWLAAEYDTTAEGLREMVSKGEVDAETFRKVIAENIGGAALESGNTTRGAFRNMIAAASRFGANLAGPVVEKARGFFLSAIDWIDGLSEKVGPLAERFGVWLAGALSDVGTLFRERILPVVQAVTEWIGRNAETIGRLAKAAGPAVLVIGGIASATHAVGVAMKALGLSGPVLLIMGLATAFMYAWQNSETFRNVVTAVLSAVGAAATWLWESVLQPVFGFLTAAWQATTTAVQAAWTGFLKPTWDAVAAAASWLWSSVLKPVFGFVGSAWKVLVAAVQAYWKSVLQPTWNAVAKFAQWLWGNILKPVFGTIERAWQTLVMAIQIAWVGILKPVWDAVAAAARWLWDNVLQPVFRWIGDRWSTVLGGMKSAWDTVLAPVIRFFGDRIEGLRDIFGRAVSAIGDAWDGIKRIFAAPVNWVIDNVLNKFIGWINGIAEKLGLSWRISLVPNVSWGSVKTGPAAPDGSNTIRRNKGGIIPGGGPDRDSVLTHLTPGEYVLSRTAVRNLGGPGQVDAMHAAAVSGDLADATGGPMSWIKSVATSALNLARRFIVATVRPGFNAAMDLMDATVGNLGVPGQWVAGASRNIGNRILDWAANIEEEADSRVPDLSGRGWQGIVEMMKKSGVAHVVTSTLRRGDPGYHGRGKAADFSIGGHGNRGYGHAGLRAIFDALLPAQDQLAELILAGAPFNIKNGRRVGGYAWGRPGEPGNHWNHVHAAVYDQGGVVPPGVTQVRNWTRKPEALLTDRQWSAVYAAASGGDGASTFHLYDTDRALLGTMRGVAEAATADAARARARQARQLGGLHR